MSLAQLLNKFRRPAPPTVPAPKYFIAPVQQGRQTPPNDRGIPYTGRLRPTPLCQNTQPKAGRHRYDEGPTEILRTPLPTQAARVLTAERTPTAREVFQGSYQAFGVVAGRG